MKCLLAVLFPGEAEPANRLNLKLMLQAEGFLNVFVLVCVCVQMRVPVRVSVGNVFCGEVKDFAGWAARPAQDRLSHIV
jgi:hypothetical protein